MARRLTTTQFEARKRAFAAARRIRQGESPTAAARREGTTVRTLKKTFGADLKPGAGGRLELTRDRALRRVRVLAKSDTPFRTPYRIMDLSRREASIAGRHASAVGHYVDTGDSSRLGEFEGVRVQGVELETDLDVIDDLAGLDLLSFEDLYEIAA